MSMTYTMRRTWPDDPKSPDDYVALDYVVLCDGKDVGRMYRTIGVGGAEVWQWTIYGTNKAGREPTLEAAWRAAFEAKP